MYCGGTSDSGRDKTGSGMIPLWGGENHAGKVATSEKPSGGEEQVKRGERVKRPKKRRDLYKKGTPGNGRRRTRCGARKGWGNRFKGIKGLRRRGEEHIQVKSEEEKNKKNLKGWGAFLNAG